MLNIKTLNYKATSLILGCFLALTIGHAQNMGPSTGISSLKIAFITQQLALSTEEAQVFWPIYNEYSDELEKLRRDGVAKQAELRTKFNSLSDKDLVAYADMVVDQKKREYEITDKYHEKFKKVLPIRKVILLYRAEQQFRQKILEEIRNRRQGDKKVLPEEE